MKQTDKEKEKRNKELKIQRELVRSYRLQCNKDTLFLKGSVDKNNNK